MLKVVLHIKFLSMLFPLVVQCLPLNKLYSYCKHFEKSIESSYFRSIYFVFVIFIIVRLANHCYIHNKIKWCVFCLFDINK